MLFKRKSIRVVEYCAAEVQRQQDTPEHVGHMVRAWDYAVRQHPLILDDVMTLGALVKPSLNPSGRWRNCYVRVGNDPCPTPDRVSGLMGSWYQDLHLHTPAENYVSFLEVHPFRDGNGRVAKIILCWLAGALDDPFSVEIPNPWGISNP